MPGLLAGVKPSKGKLVPLANPAWSALINSHWHQYLAMVLGYLVCLYSDRATPFRRAIYHETDAELWRVRGGRGVLCDGYGRTVEVERCVSSNAPVSE